MLINELKLCYKDIAVAPAIKSNVEHRSECDPYTGKYDGVNHLPIFTAPMSTVVCEENFAAFENCGIIPILPRNVELKTRVEYLQRGKWAAVGLEEFETLFIDNDWDFLKYAHVKVLIDIANGHMTKMHNLVRDARDKYGWEWNTLQIMVGNVANPQTYYELAKAGANYIRLSVGTGSGCITSSNTAIHYPIASLISETYEIKKRLEHSGEWTPYIIADGGIRNFDDIVKSYALGSDFVMIGSVLSQLIESSAETFYYKEDGSKCYVDQFEDEIVAKGDGTFTINDVTVSNLHKVFYGMASRRGQEDINGKKTKTSEGIEKIFDVTTNMNKWVENLIATLQSAMSYTNCFYIDDFNPNNVDCVVVSVLTRESINK